MTELEPQPTKSDLDAAYRERARLLAYLAELECASLAYSDPEAKEWPVLTIETGQGQMCWHISKADLDLFPHVPWEEPAPWDGHTVEQKWERLRKHVERLAGRTW